MEKITDILSSSTKVGEDKDFLRRDKSRNNEVTAQLGVVPLLLKNHHVSSPCSTFYCPR